ncbi:IS3 family transposase [Sedimentisphaera cyanobacteriorum]|uniref:IS3 family transposase n=1 Tax=Sedimentisphaera cyanobacteriorum TaxID=1940790 RepID=UPI0036F44321
MRRSRFSESQILSILKESEAGLEVSDLTRKYGISRATFYNWKSKYSGIGGSEIRRLRELERENGKLKKMYADLSLENNVLKDLIEKNFLKPAERKDFARQAHSKGLCVQSSCKAAGISRGSFYYTPSRNDDAEVKRQIELVIDSRPRRGFPKIFDSIRRKGYSWNHKKVYRVYKENEFQLNNRKKNLIRQIELKPMPEATRANEIWSIDFMSDSLSNGRPFRAFNVIDEFNREALDIEIDTSLPSLRIIRSLELIGSDRGFPRFIRSDNGPEFRSLQFRRFCCRNRIRHRRIEAGKPQQNSFIERFNRSYREDILDMYSFKNLSEARNLTLDWLIEYNYERGHESLGGKTPVEYVRSFLPFTPQNNSEGAKGKNCCLKEFV